MNEQERTKFLLKVGNRIKQLRIQRELSQEELAKRCGYTSRSTINKIELGINDIPQSKIKVIAQALDVPISQILCLDEINQNVDDKHFDIYIDKFDTPTDAERTKTIELIKKHFGKDALRILNFFQELNSIGKQKAIEDLEDLSNLPKYTESKKKDE